MTSDDLAVRLRATFTGELQEQVRVMNQALIALEASPGDQDHLNTLFRVAHTLKGASRAANVGAVERTCHAMESLLAEAREGRRLLDAKDFETLFSAADALGEAGGDLAAGRDVGGPSLDLVHRTLTEGRRSEAQRLPPRTVPAAPARGSSTPPPSTPKATVTQDVRVGAAKLDALLASGGELRVAGARPGLRAAELEHLRDELTRCAARWRRESRRLRVLMDRGNLGTGESSLMGLEEDLHRIEQEARRLAGAARVDAHAVAKSVESVLHEAMTLRLRPFAEACEALPRAVRDVATFGGKEVRLSVGGGDVEGDRLVLDGLREALLHLVRNAVDHGIEPPDARAAAGKPRGGTVRVEAEPRGERLLVTVADDGAGLDIPAIREALRRRREDVPDDGEGVARALLETALTTAPRATPISGRGVGLDVVREAVRRLGGNMDVTSTPGRGTTFILDVPVSLASTRVLLVGVSSHLVAIPSTHVLRVLRVPPSELRRSEGRRTLPWDGGPVPVVELARLLPPLDEHPHPEGPLLLVLLAAGTRRLAVVVDELHDAREVSVRPVRGNVTHAPSLRGVALLESGRLALVLAPHALLTTDAGTPPGGGDVGMGSQAAPVTRKRILVVDDSITTRALERSILEAAGYEVITAVDGSDGLRKIQEGGCDLVVADVEMPHMDGFGLCRAIRSSRLHERLPIVLVTALETPEHRARGLDAGADAYIGKSGFDQQGLLASIRQLLG